MPDPVESALGAAELGDLLLKRLEATPDLDRRGFEQGKDLIREGESADSVFVLVNGQLEVSKTIDGKKAVLAELSDPGTVIGEMVTLGGGHRTATVSALTDSEVIWLSASQFRSLMSNDAEFSSALAALAVRRAEEGELAEILVRRFQMGDPNAVASACSTVSWKSLRAGDRLFVEDTDASSVFFVVRGRFISERRDPNTDSLLTVGEFAKGDVIGELSVLSHSKRIATVTALRRSVVAEMPADDFLRLTDSKPKLLVELALSAVERFNHQSPTATPATIIALAAPALDRERLLTGLLAELGRNGVVRSLSAARVDALLETAGIANSDPGEVGDVRVSRLVHEFEIESDHLILDVGDENCAWARRALSLADHILVVCPEGPTEEHVQRARSLLVDCPDGVPRTLVVEHSNVSRPTGTARLLNMFACNSAIHVTPDSQQDLNRAARVVAGHANALVIGGGGARGFAHIGAYRALLELGIPVDIIAGTSIGAVLGTSIADGEDPDEILDMAEKQFEGVLDYTLPVVSLIKAERITSAAEARFGDRQIEDFWKTYLAVSTDLTTSRPHLHSSGSIVTAIRATSAIPGVMPPVPLDGALLVDGGVLNNLPMDVARSKAPAGQVIAFDVASPRGPGAHGDYGLAVSGWKALRSRSGPERSPYPRVTAVLMRSMITASMRERDRQVSTGLADFYINLDMRGVSMLDFSNPKAVAERGYESAMSALESWLSSRDGTSPDIQLPSD